METIVYIHGAHVAIALQVPGTTPTPSGRRYPYPLPTITASAAGSPHLPVSTRFRNFSSVRAASSTLSPPPA